MNAKFFDYETGKEITGIFSNAAVAALREGQEIEIAAFRRYRIQKIVTSHSNILGFPFGRPREVPGVYVEDLYPAPFRERLCREMGIAA